jgi:glycosyltransferase involved in cell wall biosynthesis
VRIAFLAVKNPIRGGGIEKYTYELGSRLVERGHEVAVYSMTHYGRPPDRIAGIKVIPVFSFRRPCLQKMSASVVAALHAAWDGSYDIVHLHSVASGALGFLPRLRQMGTVLQMHGLEWLRCRWGRKGATVLKFLEKTAVHQNLAVTAVSRRQCDYLRDRYGCEVEYIPTATAVPEKAPPHTIQPLGLGSDQYVLFASRLVPDKGAHFLIEAFKRMKTDLSLVIAGGCHGEEAYRSRLLEMAKGDRRIIFTGHVEGQLLAGLFSHAYLYVQPSTIEGMSLALLEAMSYGRCCLVSDIRENVEPLGGTGYSFRSGDVEDLCSKLQWLAVSPPLVQAVRAGARERVRREYSWEAVVDKIEDLYARVRSQPVGVRTVSVSHVPERQRQWLHR